MVSTTPTSTKRPEPTRREARARQRREPEVSLRDLVRPLAVRRGVPKQASDWVSRLERRGGIYLPL